MGHPSPCMDAELTRIEALFHRAAELPPEERTGLLERECAGESTIRARVEAMLAHLDAGSSLARPAVGGQPDVQGEGPGDLIGRYKLLQHIGDGGFGSVWMAEQTEPIRRKVALKIIKLGMDTRQVVARFEAERQALALMDHPNIAQVYDGGATETGRPYFVMELVRGISITEYCDTNNLGPRERLDLFVRVCHAVQHAHQKGVVHRDIKPSNVLVTMHDGQPVPKVIDFGIAKAMHARLTEKTLFTEFRQFVGTPVYMSPEQAEMSGLDVDTRTDIYSLGVLLYELLTGTTPFDVETLLARGYAEIQRVIREEEPPRPSLRVSTHGEAGEAARHRRLDRKVLARALRGDLDWIVMRALEKDRSRRYASASELADDVLRHLSDDPVLASPPSAAYRLKKALIKNRTAVGWAATFAAALVAGIVGTTWGMLEAARQRDQAVLSSALAEQRSEAAQEARAEEARQRRRAEVAAAHAHTVTGYLTETLALTDPKVAGTPDLSVRALLDRASAQVDGALAGQPRAEATVRATIGRAYSSLSEWIQAEAHLRRASDLMRDVEDFDGPLHYHTLWALTDVVFSLGRPDAFEVAYRARRVGHDVIRGTHHELAGLLDDFVRASDDRDLDRAEALFLRVRTTANAELAPGHPAWTIMADTWMHVGFSNWHTPEEPRTVPFWREALAIRRRELPPDDPQAHEPLIQLVGVLNRSGRAAEAEVEIRDTVQRLSAIYGDENPRAAFARSMLGENLAHQGRHAEAEPELLAGHTVLIESADESGFMPMDSLARLVELYDGWGRPEAAAPYRRELALLAARGRYPLGWPLLVHAFAPEQAAIRSLLEALQERATAGEGPRSIDLEAFDAALASVPAADPLAACIGRDLVRLAPDLAEGDRRGLVELALRLLEPWRERVPPGEYAHALALSSELALAAGEEERALRLARESWEVVRQKYDEESWFSALAKTAIGRIFASTGLHQEAETLLLQSLSVLHSQLGPDHSHTREAREELARLYRATGRSDEAERYLAPPHSPESTGTTLEGATER